MRPCAKFFLAAFFLMSGVAAQVQAPLSAPMFSTTPADLARARTLAAEALKARTANRPAEYLQLMQEGIVFRPNMPGMMHRLAGAYAANVSNSAAGGDNRERALGLLEKLARMGLAFNVAGDADFAALKDDVRFRAVVEAMAENTQPVVKSRPAFELAEKDFLPEGIAYDEHTRSFFIASVHQRKIVKRLWTGQVKPLSAAADGLWSVVAIAVDAKRRLLWATTAAMDQTRDVDEKDIGRTAILKYDLDREKLLARLELPRSDVKRVFGDLVVAANGDVYISESLEGGLYRVSGEQLQPFVAPGSFASPQGMVIFPNNRQWLYVADYSLGLARVDLQSKNVVWLSPPADSCLLGMDALTRHGNKLIATQNGLRPHRVVEIALDAQGQLKHVARLESSHPRYSEPTLGVVVGNDFYYVANSQWDFFERGKTPPLEQLKPPLILRLPLVEKK